MKKIAFVSLAGTLASMHAYAQEEIATADDVVVTASRVAQSRESAIADITVIDREEIERAGQSSLVDLLQRQPGIGISSNGGPGKQTSVFIRGTNDDQVVVLVDGLRVNSATMGKFSFENMPTAQIDRIEILRGPASSLYGADAVGGVIQIFTRKGGSDKPQIRAAAGMGSRNTKTAEAGISAGANGTNFGISVSSFATDGFSARHILAKNVPLDKDDDGYWNLGASAYVEHTLAPGHQLRAQIFESRGRNHYDREQNFDNYGNQTLQSYALSTTNQITDFWLSKLSWGAGIDDSDDHFKPTASNRRGISDFRTKQRQITWQNELHLPLGSLTLAYDRLEQDVESINSPTAGFRKDRNNDGYVASYLLDQDNHSLQLSLREDHNTQYGTHTTGNAGYGYRFAPGWRISANYGSAFRAPTFNQLFFPNFGDPDLKPEKSDNIEAVLRYSGNTLNAGLAVFENHIRNLIENTGPAAGNCTLAGFCPINAGKAEIRGVTVDAAWHIDDHWQLGGNFTVQSPRLLNDRDTTEDESGLLVRRARRYGTINLGWSFGQWQLGSEIVSASERFNNDANTKRMGGYTLLNLTGSYLINPELKLEARADNVLDKDYVLAYTGNTATSAPYNTAGASLFIGLRWQPQ